MRIKAPLARVAALPPLRKMQGLQYDDFHTTCLVAEASLLCHRSVFCWQRLHSSVRCVNEHKSEFSAAARADHTSKTQGKTDISIAELAEACGVEEISAIYRNPYVSSTRDVEITSSESESKDDMKDANSSGGITEDGTTRRNLIGNALHLLS